MRHRAIVNLCGAQQRRTMLEEMTARGCVWEVLANDSLIVTYCDDGANSEMWSAYLRMMHGLKGRAVRLLIYCSASPPREILTKIASIARGQPWQVSLLSSSTAVRFAASTFAMIVRGFRFFPPERIQEALEHLKCSASEQDEARKALARCRGLDASIPPR